ncbi:MAG: alpha/beta hydrolase [Candidatus Diapherotrites archaeon]
MVSSESIMREYIKRTKARLVKQRERAKLFRVASRVTPIVFNREPVNVHSTFVKGDKTPLVFLTGLGCSQADFRHALEQFKGHSILLFDFPGQGVSPRFPPAIPKNFNFSMGELADLTKTMLDHFGLNKVVLVGHSMGGVVGRKFVATHPERVSLFVDVEGPLNLSECQRCVRMAKAKGREFSSVIKGITKEYAGKDNPAEARYSSTFEHASPLAVRKYSESLVKEFSQGNKQPLAGLGKGKVVYFAGANNKNPELQRLKEQGIPVITHPNTGHFIMEENPRHFYNKLAELLK